MRPLTIEERASLPEQICDHLYACGWAWDIHQRQIDGLGELLRLTQTRTPEQMAGLVSYPVPDIMWTAPDGVTRVRIICEWEGPESCKYTWVGFVRDVPGISPCIDCDDDEHAHTEHGIGTLIPHTDECVETLWYILDVMCREPNRAEQRIERPLMWTAISTN